MSVSRCTKAFSWLAIALPLVCTISCARDAPDSVTPPAYDGPAVSDFAIWRPYFAVGTQQIDPDRVEATAFALARSAESPVLVTTLHTSIGAETAIEDEAEAASLVSSIRNVMISEAFGADAEMRPAGLILPLAESAARDGTQAIASLANDVLLCDTGASTKRVRPLSLQIDTPAVGDSVWMATAVYGGASPSIVAHEAILTECNDDGRWAYRFSNEDLSLKATFGAPLLNREGKVIGVHLTTDTAIEEVNGIGISGQMLKGIIDRVEADTEAPDTISR